MLTNISASHQDGGHRNRSLGASERLESDDFGTWIAGSDRGVRTSRRGGAYSPGSILRILRVADTYEPSQPSAVPPMTSVAISMACGAASRNVLP